MLRAWFRPGRGRPVGHSKRAPRSSRRRDVPGGLVHLPVRPAARRPSMQRLGPRHGSPAASAGGYRPLFLVCLGLSTVGILVLSLGLDLDVLRRATMVAARPDGARPGVRDSDRPSAAARQGARRRPVLRAGGVRMSGLRAWDVAAAARDRAARIVQLPDHRSQGRGQRPDERSRRGVSLVAHHGSRSALGGHRNDDRLRRGHDRRPGDGFLRIRRRRSRWLSQRRIASRRS